MALDAKVEFGTAKQMIDMDPDFQLRDTDKDLKRVDLACGTRKREGFIGLDRVKTDESDIIHDLLTFPWPFEDDEIYEFNCEHFIEHIPHQIPGVEQDGFFKFFEEVYRCLMPGGTIRITCPYYTSMEAWQDPTHVRAITERTFAYLDAKTMKSFGLDHYTPKVNFEVIARLYRMHPECEPYSDERRQYMIKYYCNVVQEFEVTLRKRPME